MATVDGEQAPAGMLRWKETSAGQTQERLATRPNMDRPGSLMVMVGWKEAQLGQIGRAHV